MFSRLDARSQAAPAAREVRWIAAIGSVRSARMATQRFAWVWQERVDPKKARVPNPEVLAVRVADLDDKQTLLALARKYFTEPHYDGFPAVLVRLRSVSAAELRHRRTEAWRCQAPRALVQEHEAAPKT